MSLMLGAGDHEPLEGLAIGLCLGDALEAPWEVWELWELGPRIVDQVGNDVINEKVKMF